MLAGEQQRILGGHRPWLRRLWSCPAALLAEIFRRSQDSPQRRTFPVVRVGLPKEHRFPTGQRIVLRHSSLQHCPPRHWALCGQPCRKASSRVDLQQITLYHCLRRQGLPPPQEPSPSDRRCRNATASDEGNRSFQLSENPELHVITRHERALTFLDADPSSGDLGRPLSC